MRIVLVLGTCFSFCCAKDFPLCPQHWQYFEGRCFSFFLSLRSWAEGSAACQSRDAHLVTIADQGTQDFMTNLVRLSEQDYWLGLRYNYDSGRWSWENGQKTEFKNWFPSSSWRKRPNNKNCGCMMGRTSRVLLEHVLSTSVARGGWTQDDCVKNKRFICEKPAVNHVVACSENWQLHGNTCFVAHQKPLPWRAARRVCQGKQGDIVVIRSHDEQSFINEMIQQRLGNYWTGLHYSRKADKWVWLNATSSLDYVNWASSLPDKKRARQGEECVYLTGGRISWPGSLKPVLPGMWRHIQCSQRLMFICQRPADLLPISDVREEKMGAPSSTTRLYRNRALVIAASNQENKMTTLSGPHAAQIGVSAGVVGLTLIGVLVTIATAYTRQYMRSRARKAPTQPINDLSCHPEDTSIYSTINELLVAMGHTHRPIVKPQTTHEKEVGNSGEIVLEDDRYYLELQNEPDTDDDNAYVDCTSGVWDTNKYIYPPLSIQNPFYENTDVMGCTDNAYLEMCSSNPRSENEKVTTSDDHRKSEKQRKCCTRRPPFVLGQMKKNAGKDDEGYEQPVSLRVVQ